MMKKNIKIAFVTGIQDGELKSKQGHWISGEIQLEGDPMEVEKKMQVMNVELGNIMDRIGHSENSYQDRKGVKMEKEWVLIGTGCREGAMFELSVIEGFWKLASRWGEVSWKEKGWTGEQKEKEIRSWFSEDWKTHKKVEKIWSTIEKDCTMGLEHGKNRKVKVSQEDDRSLNEVYLIKLKEQEEVYIIWQSNGCLKRMINDWNEKVFKEYCISEPWSEEVWSKGDRDYALNGEKTINLSLIESGIISEQTWSSGRVTYKEVGGLGENDKQRLKDWVRIMIEHQWAKPWPKDWLLTPDKEANQVLGDPKILREMLSDKMNARLENRHFEETLFELDKARQESESWRKALEDIPTTKAEKEVVRRV